MSNDKEPRNPQVIAGAIREHVERLERLLPESTSVHRLDELCDELDASLTLQMLTSSLAVQR